jgi:hypothetical protein
MAVSAPHPSAFELRAGRRPWPREEVADRLYLRETGDGWSLLNSRGEVLIHGLGLGARRKCLEFAREVGVLVVFA